MSTKASTTGVGSTGQRTNARAVNPPPQDGAQWPNLPDLHQRRAHRTVARREATMRALQGGVPERPKGTGCKPVGSAYGGSNPPAPIIIVIIISSDGATCARAPAGDLQEMRSSDRQRVPTRSRDQFALRRRWPSKADQA